MATPIPYHQPLQRTQISLPLTLRQQINQVKKSHESLAEFIRQAIELKIKEGQQEQTDRQARIKAAKAFIGSVKLANHPEWSTPKKVIAWQRKMRQDRPSFLKLLKEKHPTESKNV